MVGQTESSTGNIIATAGSHQPAFGGNQDAYLVKFDASGVRLWATYYGGTSIDDAYGCSTDAEGNVYLVGITLSTNGIATTGSHQTINGGIHDGFLAKFNASGVRQWATYYGGTENDEGRKCVIDDEGNVYLAGYTVSANNIGTAGSHQSTFGGIRDGFLAKFHANGVREWGTART